MGNNLNMVYIRQIRFPLIQTPDGGALGKALAVLIVDDEEGILEMASRILEEHGVSSLKARSGEEALAVFRSNCDGIGLVLMDLGLPGLSGIEAMSAMLCECPHIRVIISSGTDEDEFSQALSLGAYACLGKPYRMQALVDCVKSALSKAGGPGSDA